MAKFCGKCGASLEVGDRFCIQCGEPIEMKEQLSDAPSGNIDGETLDEADEVLRQMREDNQNRSQSPKSVAHYRSEIKKANPDVNSEMSFENAADNVTINDKDLSEQEEKGNQNKFQSLIKEKHHRSKIQKEKSTHKTASPKTNGKTIMIIAGIIVGIIVISALIFCFATGILPPKSTVPISFKISIDDNFTKDSTPIVAKLQDQNNKDQVIYQEIDASKKNNASVDVPGGVYEVSFISPINADGSIYLTNEAVKVDTVAKEETTVDAEFALLEAKTVTETQLQGIADDLTEANKSGGVSNETVKMADERVSKKKEELQQQKMAIDEEAIYADLIKTYAVGVLDNYDTPQLKQLDMSTALAPALTDPKDSYGYALIDLDGDGIREMITGHVDDKGQTTNGDIYDMYTIQNNKPLHVLSSTDRTRWYYCGKGQIYKTQATGTSHNGENATLYYLCKPNTSLDLIEGVENTGKNGVSSYYVYENGTWKDAERSDAQQKMNYLMGLRKDYSMIPFKK